MIWGVPLFSKTSICNPTYNCWFQARHCTPLKINGWNLKIFQTSIVGYQPWIFQGCTTISDPNIQVDASEIQLTSWDWYVVIVYPMIYKVFYVFFSDFLNHQQPNPTLNPSIPTPIQPNCSRGQANKSPVSINLAFARALASTWKTVVGGLGPNDLYFWRQNLQKKAQSPIKTRVIYLYRDIYNIYIYFQCLYMYMSDNKENTTRCVSILFWGGWLFGDCWFDCWLLFFAWRGVGGWELWFTFGWDLWTHSYTYTY